MTVIAIIFKIENDKRVCFQNVVDLPSVIARLSFAIGLVA